jgi:hypothetical protein
VTRPLWSILITTHASRASRFTALIRELTVQVQNWHDVTPPDAPPVELVGLYNWGGLPLGEYRQDLQDAATGDYLSFFDDDDWPAPEFVYSAALAMISQRPEIVSFDVTYTEAGKPTMWEGCVLDITGGWHETGAVMHRDLTVVQPLRADVARLGRLDGGWPEDRAWRKQVLEAHPQDWTQARIPRPLNQYRHDWADSVEAGNLRLTQGLLDTPAPAIGSPWFRWIETAP